MKRPFGLPLGVSIVGHCCILLALILFVGRIPLPLSPRVPRKEGIEVTLAPALPVAPPQPPPPIPELPPPPSSPPPMVLPTPPPPPPRPEHRVVVRPPPRRPPPPERRVVRPQYQPPPTPYVPPTPSVPPPPQPAAIPRPATPLISAGYRAALSAWFASHKPYPESARDRGEEGEAVLRFRVDRSGRVLSFALARSTGYPDLDAAVEAMIRGAALPPFPPDMSANDIEVTVPVRFSLVR